MIMMARRWWFLGLLAMLLPGCASLLFPTSPAPVYYQLDYSPRPVRCSRAFTQGVRVWNFGASQPYQRTEMAVLRANGKVSFSSAFQWVASPGTLVAESLLRDLTCSSLFPQAIGANDPGTVPLELSGHVFVFAWERADSTSSAVLQVEVSLIDTRTPRKVKFRQAYNLRSGPFVDNSSAAFAQAMSALMAEFSEKFQRDLCATLAGSKGSSDKKGAVTR
jgi:ABC-type uncharacterized transport system auxiliary subunit